MRFVDLGAHLAVGLVCLAVSATAAPAKRTADEPVTTGPRMAYLKSDGVYISRFDGTGAQKLMPAKDISNIAISPEGADLAYTVNIEKKNDFERHIELYNFASQKSRRLTAVQGNNNYGPIWSPTGYWIMVQHYRDRKWEIAIVGADNDRFRVLTDKISGREDILSPAWWSADGQFIFCYDFKFFYQVDIQGREISRVPVATILGDVEMSSGYSFSLSSNGKLLLFDALKEVPDIKTLEGPPSQIYLRQVGEIGGKRVSPKGLEGIHPAWIPGDQSFLFVGGAYNKRGIYRMNVDGTTATLVAPGVAEISTTR
ncbi:MAG: hypothetical protein K1X53_10425 [Candidatus Sumerlaeaceae bacterium]|nr:hypothetical protein [Candidatus Sumerlaeaceae bacterium]